MHMRILAFSALFLISISALVLVSPDATAQQRGDLCRRTLESGFPLDGMDWSRERPRYRPDTVQKICAAHRSDWASAANCMDQLTTGVRVFWPDRVQEPGREPGQEPPVRELFSEGEAARVCAHPIRRAYTITSCVYNMSRAQPRGELESCFDLTSPDHCLNYLINEGTTPWLARMACAMNTSLGFQRCVAGTCTAFDSVPGAFVTIRDCNVDYPRAATAPRIVITENECAADLREQGIFEYAYRQLCSVDPSREAQGCLLRKRAEGRRTMLEQISAANDCIGSGRSSVSPGSRASTRESVPPQALSGAAGRGPVSEASPAND